MVHPRRRLPVRTPKSLGLPYRRVRLRGDDVTLAAWHVPCEGSRAGLVLCHGLNRNRMQFLPLLQPLHQAGFHLLLFDFRGMGLSGGTVCTFGDREQWDVLAGVRWLRDTARVERVGLYGFSMGGACSLLAAARDPDVAALVTDCAFARLDELLDIRVLPLPTPLRDPVHRSVRYWAERRYARVLQVNPERAVQQWRPRPLLVIHGGNDQCVPPDHGHRLAAAAGETAELWIIPDAAHVRGCLREPFQYPERVTSFFRRHLLGIA
jgi:dipeptidyl aminopeptidase/acylaminoacyl peptidase